MLAARNGCRRTGLAYGVERLWNGYCRLRTERKHTYLDMSCITRTNIDPEFNEEQGLAVCRFGAHAVEVILEFTLEANGREISR